MIHLAIANIIAVAIVLLTLPLLSPSDGLRRRGLLVAASLAVIAGAIAIYAAIGSPHLGDRPLAEREVATANPEIAGLLERARSRLVEEPTDIDAWIWIANAEGLSRRYGEAALAMAEAAVLDPGNAEHLARQGEFIVLAHDGLVTPAARLLFAQSLAIDASQPVARFYGGVALAQAGDTTGALVVWRDLLADSPVDAPWIGELRRHISDAGEAAGDSGDDTLDMITGMVEGLARRLADEPDDLEGWKRLAHSYTVLEDWPKARHAYERALELAPGDSDLMDGFAAAVAAPVDRTTGVSATVLADMERVLETRPDNPHALYVTGLAAALRGDNGGAREQWTRLRDLFEPSTSEYSRVGMLLESIE
ncbi:MAG: tetratricopeptide repeat protein [bacterium]|nr:tetratricopeptide repeat protein [bacterium]